MIKVSCCMIVRDGEQTIERALKSVKPYVDEMVVAIDSRTNDNTREIVGKYFEFDWTDDFAAARNQCISKAEYDWVLIIDADDWIEPGKEEIFRHALTLGNGIRFTIQTGPTTSVKSIRCFNRTETRYIYRVHEYPQISKAAVSDPKIIDAPIIINHEKGPIIDPERNIRILETALSEYPRYLFYHGRECLTVGRYEDAIKSFEKYLEISTWKAERNEAMIGMARCYLMLNQVQQAKEMCLSIVAVDENFKPALNLLGQIAEHEKRYHDAKKWLVAAIEASETEYVFNDVQPTDANSWVCLSKVRAELGMLPQSRYAAVKADMIGGK
jgi:glycosyltransferase involved in cell wall biosynthesis